MKLVVGIILNVDDFDFWIFGFDLFYEVIVMVNFGVGCLVVNDECDFVFVVDESGYFVSC